jgi:hypothetical protein
VAQPEYDFFSAPGGGGATGGTGSGDPRFGGAAAPADTPTNQFAPGGLLGSTPAGRYGGPTGQNSSAGQQYGAPAQSGNRARPRRPGRPRWAIGLIATAVAVVVLGVVAVVAVPVFLAQRGKATYQATRLVLPSAVEGLPRNTALKVAGITKQVQVDSDATMPGVFTVSGMGYGSTGQGRAAIVVVAAAKRPLTADEQATLRHGTIAQMARQGEKITAESPGRLGGSFDCLVRGSSTTCIALDPAGLFTITVGHGNAKTQVETARRIRESVELRA